MAARVSRLLSWRNVRRLVYVYSTCHVVGRHVGEVVFCSGPSMHPTIHDGDLVIAERLSVTLGNLWREDIVGALAPYDPGQLLCKRLTRLEYDRVRGCNAAPELRRVPKGHVYLEGDNTMLSTDSRSFGPVPQGLVEFRLVLRVWPLSRAGWLSSHWFWEQPDHGDVSESPR